MAKKKPPSGLTAAELAEVKTLEQHVVKEEAKAAASPPASEKPEDEIARLEAEIVVLQAKIFALQHPYQAWPKMVGDKTYRSQEALDAGRAD